jgi:hypothetical protein
MDTLITFPEVKEFLKNPHSLAPCPDFTRLETLRWHMNEAQKQLSCPQSTIHGWVGLVIYPTMYAFTKMIPFSLPHDPGDVTTLSSIAAPAAIKIAKHLFESNKMYFTSYKNIYRACFKMLNHNISNKPKCQPTHNSKAGILPWLSRMYSTSLS